MKLIFRRRSRDYFSLVFRLSSKIYSLTMKWILAVFGRAGSPLIADEVEKYVKRLRGSAKPLEVVELKESKLDDHAQALAERIQARHLVRRGETHGHGEACRYAFGAFSGKHCVFDWIGVWHRREFEKDGGLALELVSFDVHPRSCTDHHRRTTLPRPDGHAESSVSS